MAACRLNFLIEGSGLQAPLWQTLSGGNPVEIRQEGYPLDRLGADVYSS